MSPFVREELSNGNPEAANRRLQVVSHLPMLSVNEEIKKLADTYFVAISLPERARLDASHLAMAVWHQMDYLKKLEYGIYSVGLEYGIYSVGLEYGNGINSLLQRLMEV